MKHNIQFSQNSLFSIYTWYGSQNILCRIVKGHSDIFLGCSFAIPPFLVYKSIIG